jgi:RNA polymerase sigma factor (sigma-70 family)
MFMPESNNEINNLIEEQLADMKSQKAGQVKQEKFNAQSRGLKEKFPEEASSPEEIFLKQTQEQEIWKLFEESLRIPPRDKEIFIERYVNEVSTDEIGKKFNITKTRVNNILNKVREDFKKEIEAQKQPAGKSTPETLKKALEERMRLMERTEKLKSQRPRALRKGEVLTEERAFTPEQKAWMTLRALALPGHQKSIELEYGPTEAQFEEWKKTILENAHTLFPSIHYGEHGVTAPKRQAEVALKLLRSKEHVAIYKEYGVEKKEAEEWLKILKDNAYTLFQ